MPSAENSQHCEILTGVSTPSLDEYYIALLVVTPFMGLRDSQDPTNRVTTSL